MKKISGVGINDADYSVNTTVVIDNKNMVVTCQFYTVWKSMIDRCYGASQKKNNPTYGTCTVCSAWLTFSNFKEWMMRQDYHNKQLDKDLLITNNTKYSPDTCCFITKRLNSFLTESTKSRGKYPVGVTIDNSTGRFRSRVNNPHTGKYINLGTHSTPEDAHRAWREMKHVLTQPFILDETNQRIIAALQTRYITL